MNIKKVSILSSFLGIAISLSFAEIFSVYLALFLIISIGILHGANDILLIEKSKFVVNKNKWYIKLTYVFIVLLAVILFYFVPFYALIIFILFSAYHFGEQHWSQKFSTNQYGFLKKVFQFTFGLLILSLLFLLKPETTNQVIEDLANFSVPFNWFTYLSACSLTMSLIFSVLLLIKKELILTKFSFEFSLLILYTLVFYFTPLILGFAIYFAFWHSLPSLNDQIKFIYGGKLVPGIKSYIKDAGIYWLVSVVGFAAFLFFFYETKLFYSFLFAFIAAITFPHVIVMGKMFSYLKKQKSV
ncbi:hypothetical protein GCM10010832_08440 [Psychroflexus planctonicus]|uniref:Probable beta-carotene 15,15'-dioxygenase n=1 Tax=Psychroflexus planctonicus TaxID=1526575 RepID=A0ABQ1SE82_9FLAO|nr:hypothetical protein GCM10010832_08440 [Psychroflexus planctonicus]